jgi:exonuclease III
MKGADCSGKHDDASTAGTNGVSDEERSETRDPSSRGLSGCTHLLYPLESRNHTCWDERPNCTPS